MMRFCRPVALVSSLLCLSVLASCGQPTGVPSNNSEFRAGWYGNYRNTWGGGGWGRDVIIAPPGIGVDPVDPDWGVDPPDFGYGGGDFGGDFGDF